MLLSFQTAWVAGCLGGWVGGTASCGQGPCGCLRPAVTHCPQVQDVVKCQMGVCRADESEDSPDSCKNGQLQILVSDEAWQGGFGARPHPHFPAPGPSPSPSMAGRGQRPGLVQTQPLTTGWHGASLSLVQFLNLSSGVGVDKSGVPGALLGVPWVAPLGG